MSTNTQQLEITHLSVGGLRPDAGNPRRISDEELYNSGGPASGYLPRGASAFSRLATGPSPHLHWGQVSMSGLPPSLSMGITNPRYKQR